MSSDDWVVRARGGANCILTSTANVEVRLTCCTMASCASVDQGEHMQPPCVPEPG